MTEPTPRGLIRGILEGDEDLSIANTKLPDPGEPTPRGLIRAVAAVGGPPSEFINRTAVEAPLRGGDPTPRHLIRAAAATASPYEGTPFTSQPEKRARIDDSVLDTPASAASGGGFSPDGGYDTPIAQDTTLLIPTERLDKGIPRAGSPFKPSTELAPQDGQIGELPFVPPVEQVGILRRGKARPPIVPRKPVVIGGEEQKIVDEGPKPTLVVPKPLLKSLFGSLTPLNVPSETLDSVSTALNAFFDQACEDLVAYGDHAKRKTIESTDVECLLRRQRLLKAKQSPEDLIREVLPREMVEELIPVARANNVVVPKRKRK